MAELIGPHGYFSLLRWRSNPTRDEAKNVAVILVEEKGAYGGVRAAPLSRISSRLHEQGLLDAMVVQLQKRFTDDKRPALPDLEAMREQLQQSLYLTEPKPVLVSDADLALSALYRAYVAPPPAPHQKSTKGSILDRVVNGLRRRGYSLARGAELDGFLFDLVFEVPQRRLVGEVLSFATEAANWKPVENDAGHFLYGLGRVGGEGVAVVEPPPNGNVAARRSYEKVSSWLMTEKVKVYSSDPLLRGETSLPLAADPKATPNRE